MVKIKRNKLYSDLIWYFIGNLIPILIAALRSPIFTRYFTPSEYGYYSIITVTFSLLSLILFTSISSCIWRFYNRYKSNDNLKGFYSLLIIFYCISILILAIISLVWILISQNAIIIKLVQLSFLEFSSAELIMIFFIMFKLEGNAILYNVLNSFKVLISFFILYYFTFHLNYRIEALLTSNIIVNLSLLIGLVLFSINKIGFSYKKLYKNEIKEFLTYGLASVIAKIGLLLLTFSDRYIIKLFDSYDHVGIYNQVYNLSQISIVTLATVFISAITPKLNRSLEESLQRSKKLIRKYISLYLIYLLPITVYLSIFARQVAFVLLGKEFREGYTIIPYVMISAFIFGLTMFSDIYLKFSNKLKKIVVGVILASLINIILNLILIPVFDYKIAAFTTFVSYVFLYLYYIANNGFSYLKYKRNSSIVTQIVLVLVIQILLDQFIRRLLGYDMNVVLTIIEGLIFFTLYLIFINRKYFKKAIFKFINI